MQALHLDRLGLKLELSRGPLKQHNPPSLRAWDAADELILNRLYEQYLDTYLTDKTTPLLIFNDAFGTLSCALHQYSPISITDSYLSLQACRNNLQHNRLATEQVQIENSLQWPTTCQQNIRQQPCLVLLKIPKHLAMLEFQITQLNQYLPENSLIIAGGMVKNLAKSYQQLFENLASDTRTSLAVKKARLIFAKTVKNTKQQEWLNGKYPKQIQVDCAKQQWLSINKKIQHINIFNHANVFSQDKLDGASRLLIQQLPSSDEAKNIIDLGCGNGILGTCAAILNPNAQIHFYDESFMATASAALTYEENVSEKQSAANANYVWGDSIQQAGSHQLDNQASTIGDNSADMVLLNPPFHQLHTVGDHIADMMINDAHRVLKTGGELWLVGNRHLGYHKRLTQLFGGHKIIASDRRFVVLKTRKQK